jgi:hypothetical protein
MALDTFDNLVKTIIDYSHREDLGTRVNDFILLAEAEMRSNPTEALKLNTGEVVSELLTSTTVKTIDLPVGFQSSRQFSITIENSIVDLKFRTPDQLVQRDDTGTPCFFTIRANKIEFDILPDQVYTVTVTYFAEFVPLSDTNQTNIVLAKYPNIYLFGALRHAFIYTQDVEQMVPYTSDFISAIASANLAEKSARYGPQPQVTVRWAP